MVILENMMIACLRFPLHDITMVNGLLEHLCIVLQVSTREKVHEVLKPNRLTSMKLLIQVRVGVTA